MALAELWAQMIYAGKPRCNFDPILLPNIGIEMAGRGDLGKNTSVVLGDSQEMFVKSQIAKGRYATVSEAVREGIAMLEQRELEMEHLRQLIAEGDASGDFQEVDFDALLAGEAA